MTTNVSLTPELERFARDQVASGDYGSVSEVVRDALRGLKERREARAAFTKTLEDAREEADRLGWYTADEVLAEMDAIIAEADRVHGDA
jgi:antitoxin ParD1/3/4